MRQANGVLIKRAAKESRFCTDIAYMGGKQLPVTDFLKSVFFFRVIFNRHIKFLFSCTL